MRPGALPIAQQILLDLIAPPILTIVGGLMPHGWVKAIRRSDVSGSIGRVPWFEFWVILGWWYLVAFGVTAYTWLT